MSPSHNFWKSSLDTSILHFLFLISKSCTDICFSMVVNNCREFHPFLDLFHSRNNTPLSSAFVRGLQNPWGTFGKIGKQIIALVEQQSQFTKILILISNYPSNEWWCTWNNLPVVFLCVNEIRVWVVKDIKKYHTLICPWPWSLITFPIRISMKKKRLRSQSWRGFPWIVWSTFEASSLYCIGKWLN